MRKNKKTCQSSKTRTPIEEGEIVTEILPAKTPEVIRYYLIYRKVLIIHSRPVNERFIFF